MATNPKAIRIVGEVGIKLVKPEHGQKCIVSIPSIQSRVSPRMRTWQLDQIRKKIVEWAGFDIPVVFFKRGFEIQFREDEEELLATVENAHAIDRK